MGLKAVANPSGGAIATDLAAAGMNSLTLGLPNIRWVGDSITSQADTISVGSTGSPNTAMTRYPRVVSWANWLSGSALNYVSTLSPQDFARKGSNSGIGGDSMVNVATRLPAILAACPEYYIALHIGTNDINNGSNGLGSFATMQTNMLTLINMITAAGKKPILTTVLPRNNVDGGGGFDWGATGGNTAAQKRQVLNQFNIWLSDYAKENGHICVTWHVVFEDTTTGVAKTGYTVEGLHPNENGAYWLGKEFVRQIGYLIPKQNVGHLNVLSVYDATNNPYGNGINGAFTGTGGTTADAGGAGTITGTVPDNLRLNKSTSTTTSAVSAVVTRGDGQPGNGVQLTFTSLGTGNASENWRLEHFVAASTNLTSFATAGDLLQFNAEVEVVGGHGGVLKSILTRITANNTIKTANTIAVDATLKQITDSGNGFVTAGFIAGNSVITSLFTNGGNNGTFVIQSVTAGVIQLTAAATGLVTEAAGSNRTLTMPFISTVGGGASNSAWPDDDTGIIPMTAPICQISATANITPRVDIFLNGTVAGTCVVRIFRPQIRKLSLTPALLTFPAPDA